MGSQWWPRQARTRDFVSKTAGRHMYTHTARTHVPTVALRLLGLRCQSQYGKNNTSSKRQTSHSPYWKRSRHYWQCPCPLCICDPYERKKKKERGRERERWDDKRSDSSRQTKIQQTINPFLFFHLFPPAGNKQRLKMWLCINFVQTSKNDNKQKEARAICSVRQKQSTKV